MVVVFFILLVVFATAVSGAGYGVGECPPWFEWTNTSDFSGYCACGTASPVVIFCSQQKQTSYVLQGSCTFYDAKTDKIWGSRCPFLFPDNVLQDGMFSLPTNVSELNTVVCGTLSREVKGPLCGRCTGNTGPSIYSVGSRCVHCSPVNILYYLLLQYGPSTLLFLLVIIFRPNITSAPMVHYVLFCNFTVSSCKFFLWLYTQTSYLKTIAIKFALTLSGIWSFDALLFISPPLCISHHLKEIYTPYIDLVATIYPFILLMFTSGLIKLYAKNVIPVSIPWRMCTRVFAQFYRAWDPRSSMIQAFASLFFLSYAKLTYLSWEGFMLARKTGINGTVIGLTLFSDPNVPYYSTKHIVLMILSVSVSVFLFLPPLLILLVYPTSLYRKISDRISPVWGIRIKTYVDIFNGCVKDGTDGTRDYRPLSGLIILLMGICPQFLMIVSSIVLHSDFDTNGYIVALFLSTIAFIIVLIQPYKEKLVNALAAGILIVTSLLFALGTEMYSQEEETIKVMTIILMMVPHTVFWGYNACILTNNAAKTLKKKSYSKILYSTYIQSFVKLN